MQITTAIFDKTQRKLLSDAIRGQLPGFVIVAGHAAKVREKLLESGIDVDRATVHQHLLRASNNQELFRAVFLVLQQERPEQLKELFNGTLFTQATANVSAVTAPVPDSGSVLVA